MVECFVVRSIVLSSPVAIISSVSGPAKRFYCATCFHSSTRCSPDAPPPVEFAFFLAGPCISFLSSYTFSLFFCPRVRYFLPNQDFYRAGINPCCRLRLILQLSLIQRIPCGTLLLLPSIWREIDFPFGLLHRDTWWTVNAEHTAGIAFKSN